jgi:hypothetical protein
MIRGRPPSGGRDSFLDGSAPRLRRLGLHAIPFPELLLSARGGIGYILPEAMMC